MRRRLCRVLFIAALAAAPGLDAAVAAPIDYNRDIRPILSENCFACHGFDEKARKAKLRLDVAESAYAERNGFFPLKPGDPANSEVWLRLTSKDEDEIMPPPDAHSRPTEAQKQKIKAWIEQGAKYAPHWSFVPPQKTPLPGARGGENKSAALPLAVAPSLPLSLSPSLPPASNAIDAFVLARLAEESLAPSPAADRAMLLRRVAFDLTGLPPTAEEVDAFVQDRDPQAYEQRVDQLLRSEHFGERLALEWLDAARYADTNGYSIDGGRQQWLWRDWVIQAFNDNMPYDRFLREQLAGDLLPNRTDAQLIATGFQRNNMVTHEGGTIPEENLTNYNVDRVKTLGESVLGLTLGCAQCHDHKFDPITQKEYYQMFAYFNSLGDRGLDGNGGINPGPSIQARTVLRSNEEPALRAEIARLKATLAQPDAKVLARWEADQRARLATRGAGMELHPVKALKISTPNRGAGFEVEGENRIRLRDGSALAAYDVLTQLPRLDQPITGLRVIVHPVPELPGGGWGYGGVPAPAKMNPKQKARAATLAEEPPDVESPVEVSTKQHPDATPGKSAKGTFMLTAIAATADAIPGDQVNLHKLLRVAGVTANSWETANPPAGCLDPRNDNGWSPDLATTGPVHLTATFAEPLQASATPFLTVQLNFGNGKSLIPGLVELMVLTGTDDGSELPADILSALEMPAAKRTPEIAARLWAHCAGHGAELQPQRTALINLEERLAVLTQPFTTMVMNVAAKPRDTFILNRGDYAQPTTKVSAGTPAALPALPEGTAASRLGLAEWVTMKNHPLTARVAVNRIWKMCFGTGLVATAADFGSQGEWPSHPELLDWLAVDFVESGWDVKALVRRIVLSQTYRQTSATTPALLERDPQNRLLARGARFRLPAEFIRDAALKVSGLLVPRIGGPGVNPYTPGDLWREVSHYGSTPATAQTFVQDHGEKLYRRSLYTYWKRTAPPPNMTAFDAPNREVCTIDRANTTTPLQALVTLNDPQFVEAARAFAERILRQAGPDRSRLRWAFFEATSREAKPAEMAVLESALHRERASYVGNVRAAAQYLATGESPRDIRIPPAEHAAWAQVAALLLNLSEAVTRN